MERVDSELIAIFRKIYTWIDERCELASLIWISFPHSNTDESLPTMYDEVTETRKLFSLFSLICLFSVKTGQNSENGELPNASG